MTHGRTRGSNGKSDGINGVMKDSCDSSVPQCDMDKVRAGTLQERINNKKRETCL